MMLYIYIYIKSIYLSIYPYLGFCLLGDGGSPPRPPPPPAMAHQPKIWSFPLKPKTNSLHKIFIVSLPKVDLPTVPLNKDCQVITQ